MVLAVPSTAWSRASTCGFPSTAVLVPLTSHSCWKYEGPCDPILHLLPLSGQNNCAGCKGQGSFFISSNILQRPGFPWGHIMPLSCPSAQAGLPGTGEGWEAMEKTWSSASAQLFSQPQRSLLQVKISA